MLELPVILTMLGREAFPNDFFVKEMQHYTPRFYSVGMIYVLAKTGLGLSLAYFLSYVIAFSAYFAGTYYLGKTITGNWLGGILTAFFALHAVHFTLGRAQPFYDTSVAASYAMPLSVWGMCACYRGRWLTGYSLFGIACLFQFLVGFLPAALFTPALLVANLRTGTLKTALGSLLCIGFFAGIIYIPMKVTGITQSGLMTDREFVETYAFARCP
jgi:hypothetical protein